MFVQGLAPGESRRQVTHMPALDFPGQWPEIAWPDFLDASTIVFMRWPRPGEEYEVLLVNADGTGLRELPHVTLPGGQVVPVWQVVGGDWSRGPSSLCRVSR